MRSASTEMRSVGTRRAVQAPPRDVRDHAGQPQQGQERRTRHRDGSWWSADRIEFDRVIFRIGVDHEFAVGSDQMPHAQPKADRQGRQASGCACEALRHLARPEPFEAKPEPELEAWHDQPVRVAPAWKRVDDVDGPWFGEASAYDE